MDWQNACLLDNLIESNRMKMNDLVSIKLGNQSKLVIGKEQAIGRR